MKDIIIVVIIGFLFFIGLRSTKKHLKGQGGCCGGGNSVPKQHKTLKNVIDTKTVLIDGMTCEHCQNLVERTLNSIDGVACKVNLKKKTAVISLEKEVDEETIRTAIEKAGFTVTEIK